MAADVFGTYMVLSMGLFTVASLIIGYFLLSNSVVSASRGSAYYSYVRISEAISSSIKSSSSSVTNINMYPKYLIFSAYFGSEQEIYYNIIDGLRLFMYGIPTDDNTHFSNVKNSVQSSYSNKGMQSSQELLKCVGKPCICFAELDSKLVLEPEYFKPTACVDICWGENPIEYTGFIQNQASSLSPKEKVNSANNNAVSPKCKKCVDYINSGKYETVNYEYYSVLTTGFDKNLNNLANLETLKEFSESTKFSFVQDIIECKSFDELIKSSEKNIDSLVFAYGNETISGVFALLNANENFIFKILGIEYFQNSQNNPTKSYSITSIAKSEKTSGNQIIGGN